MTSSKKDANRRSLFNLLIPTKIVVSGKPDPSPTDSGATESPASEPIIPVRKDRLRARLTRSGSKILLLLGLRGSSKSEWWCLSYYTGPLTDSPSQATKNLVSTVITAIPCRPATKVQMSRTHLPQVVMAMIAQDIRLQPSPHEANRYLPLLHSVSLPKWSILIPSHFLTYNRHPRVRVN
jgi:hypothetical protein